MPMGRGDSDTPRQPGGGVYSGLKWVAVAMVLLRCTRFLTTVVLTYLVAREDFDVMTLAMAVVMSMAFVREFGFGQAYVQLTTESEGELERARDTAFTMSFVTNLVLFAGVYALIPWFASQYPGHERMEWLLRGVFFTFVIDAFATMPAFVLQRELRFKQHSFAEMTAGVTNALLAIGMALLGCGVWSLVGGFLGSRLIQTIQLYRYAGYRPRLGFDREVAGRLFGFGKYMWGFAALSAVGANFDKLVMGKFPESIEPGDLAMYGIAYNLCLLPATQITFLVGRIAFPALSRIKDDQVEMRRAFMKALDHVAVLAVPIGLGLYAVAGELVATVYPADYANMAAIIGVMAFYGMVMAVASVSGPTFQAMGRPNVLFFTSVVHHAILFPLVLGLVAYGAVGVAIGVTVPLLVSSAIGFVLAARHLGLRPVAIAAPLLRTGLAGGVMLAVVEAQQVWIGATLPPAASLVVSVILGAGTYLLAVRVTFPRMVQELMQTVRRTAVATERA